MFFDSILIKRETRVSWRMFIWGDVCMEIFLVIHRQKACWLANSLVKQKQLTKKMRRWPESVQATYPTSNAKSLACDTANEHALTFTRETCSCSQTAVQWNQWHWSIHLYSNGREHNSDSKLPHVWIYGS